MCAEPHHCRNLRRERGAFTLLEVLLTLVISAIVLMLIGAAIDLHLRVLDQGRREVESAQLARALLRRMADDLQSALINQPVDVEALLPESETLAGSAAAAAGLGGSSSGSSSSSSGSGGSSSGSGGSSGGSSGAAALQSLTGSAASGGSSGSTATGDTSTTEEGTESSSNASIPSQPGLFGTSSEVQVDISRLPRVDQFAAFAGALGDGGLPTDRTSDVKNVAYYLVPAPASTLPAMSESAAAASSGMMLVRREVDRATAAYAYDQGDTGSLERREEVLAHEVLALEFRYHDGTGWLSEWDSSSQEALPVAVEIALALATPGNLPAAGSGLNSVGGSSAGATGGSLAASSQPGYTVYRLLVHLKSGTAVDPTATDSSESSDSSSSENSSSGSSSSGSSSSSSGSGNSSSGSGSSGGGGSSSGSSGSSSRSR